VSIGEYFSSNDWKVVAELSTEPRAAELHGVDDLPLSAAARSMLDRAYPSGIYRHQKEALRRTLEGENVCLVTGTASGKSLVFQTAAVDLLTRDPEARIMAIYPMKALGNEQRERWQKALVAAGLGHESEMENMVGRIDGNVPPGFRAGILERARVIVFTPDIIHAWMFSNLNNPAVINFLRRVRMIVVDEVHAYSGVFGSNAAFLFRRLQHLLALFSIRPRMICASATIARPAEHLQALFGQEFALVGPEYDTSPRFPLQVHLVEPTGSDRFLNEVVHLLEHLTHHTGARFIAFVDSRKQVELISSILNRLLRESAKAAAEAAAVAQAEADALEAAARAEAEAAEAIGSDGLDDQILIPRKPAPKTGRGRGGWGRKKEAEEDDQPATSAYDELDPETEVTGVLSQLNVLPYRAGYEDHDRKQIQERLAQGTLNGVVSTSALELGIDIPHLDVCVLIGVPGSATSLQQRIGRIGRHGPGTVIVVHGGDVHDQTVFAHPESFFRRPLAESALYLENEHIQYIHALCLARPGGEHDQVLEAAAKIDPKAAAAYARRSKTTWSSPVQWPEHFITLALLERETQTPRHLVSMRLEAHDRPNYTFPLRDVESQFKVERRDGPNVASMGSLSFGQLMREAYPGAIYYYATIPYRVTRVNVKSKTISVRREKRYTTQPQKTLPAVFPRLTPGGVYTAGQQADLTALETSLLVRESIRGVVEQRGRTESLYPYPLSREMGFFQDQPYFSRNYFTTGVVITHPALAAEGVNLEALAGIVYEAFLLMIPFERQDIGFAADRLRVTREPFFHEGQPFITIYDQTYGSLRLSTRLLQPGRLGRVLAEAALLGGQLSAKAASPASLAALTAMARDAFHEAHQPLAFGYDAGGELERLESRDPARWERIVMPGSKGLMVRTNEEFMILRILNTPMGLSYEGTPASMEGTGASLMPLLTDVAEIPGESALGWYDIETGVIEPSAVEQAEVRPVGAPEPPPPADPDLLARLLALYFDEKALVVLASRLGLRPGDDKRSTAAALASSVPPLDLLDEMMDLYLRIL
jgi:DEAD/DEAH box helicase domain-containing protein